MRTRETKPYDKTKTRSHDHYKTNLDEIRGDEKTKEEIREETRRVS